GDGGNFTFDGTSVTIDGSVLAPGGRIALTAMNPRAESSTPGPELSIRLGATAVLDAAGRLTNDALDGASGPLRALNGSSITLAASNILLESGSLLDVSGGARISASGTKLTAGNGGSISINVNKDVGVGARASPSAAPFDQSLVLDGTLLG